MKKKTSVAFEINEAQFKLQKQNVSHLLHLVISFLTVGCWLPVWGIIALSSNAETKRLRLKIKNLYESQLQKPV